MLRRKVVKGQQHLTVLFKALDSLRILGSIYTDKIIKVPLGFILIRGHPYLMQLFLGFNLKTLWHAGVVRRISDLYLMQLDEMVEAGVGKGMATKILAEIENNVE